MRKIKSFPFLCIAALAGSLLIASAQSPNSLPVPKPTGAYREDMVATAQSQVGYQEAANGEAIYAEWAGLKGSPWCAQFIAWCAHQAGIPPSIIPLESSTRQYRRFYSDKGRYYILNNGKDHGPCGCKGLSAGTISLSQIAPGDLLTVETNGDFSDGPDHICLAESVKNGVIRTIDGNYSDRVMRTVHLAAQIHGVCKPAYSSSIEKKDVTINASSFIYTSKEITPQVTVRIGGKVLRAGTDYSVSYADNIDVGTAFVTISGKGNYEGSVRLSYRITARSIESTAVQKIPKQVYTGKAIKPTVKIKDGTKLLVEGTDYTIAYRNNKAAGKATATVKGKGNYKGSRKLSFQIVPEKMEAPSVKLSQKRTAAISWKKSASASGYMLQYSTDSRFRSHVETMTVKGKGKKSVKIKGLVSKKTYYFRICAYKTINGKNVKGSYSKSVELTLK